MAEINQNKSNFTDLLNTYMYGKVSDRIDFYKYYRNDQHSIDDPIFTGFTFSIDTLHSPLFSIDGYDTYTETLRNTDGMDISLAKRIEEKLKRSYSIIKGNVNGYDISTISPKDYISALNDYMAGYGLQDKIYMDTILYGATDYIYMVDKVRDSNVDSSYGNTYIGDGTPNASAYDDLMDPYGAAVLAAAEDLIQQGNEEYLLGLDDENEDAGDYGDDGNDDDDDDGNDGNSPTTNAIQKKLDEQKDKIKQESSKYLDEHTKNETAVTNAKNVYDETRAKYDETKKKINSIGVSQSADVKNELRELKNKVDEALDDLLYTNDEREKSSAKTKIANCAETISHDFTDEQLKARYPDITVGTQSDGTWSKRSSYEKTEDGQTGIDSSILDLAQKVMVFKITGAPLSDAKQKEYDSLQAELKNLEKTLYGSKSNGDPLSEGNADKNSLYGKYQDAKETAETDKYSQCEVQSDIITETSNNLEDIANSIEYNVDVYDTGKSSFKINEPPAVDNEVITTPEPRYEVPQTVYDLLGFISGMEKLTTKYPYVMESISGLDEAYKKYFSVKDPYMGSGDDKISITCYESLDLRISSMFNKYFNAVYDRQYRRERVPINLRRFNCSVFVHDIRNFRKSLETFDPNRFNEMSLGDNTVSRIVEIALNSISAIEFKFYDCEIVPEETGSIFSNVTNESAGEMRSTNFTFTYGNCVINFLPFEDLNRYYQNMNDTPKETVSRTQSILDQLYVQAKIQNEGSPLGNVHGNQASMGVSKDFLFENVNDTNFRTWFDKSILGNVNNNDYREYVRNDAAVAVDDFYKTTLAENFARKSAISNMSADVLRRVAMGISASTGMPVEKVADSLNIGFINPIINASGTVQDMGNIYDTSQPGSDRRHSTGVTEGGEQIENEEFTQKDVRDLGNVYYK